MMGMALCIHTSKKCVCTLHTCKLSYTAVCVRLCWKVVEHWPLLDMLDNMPYTQAPHIIGHNTVLRLERALCSKPPVVVMPPQAPQPPPVPAAPPQVIGPRPGFAAYVQPKMMPRPPTTPPPATLVAPHLAQIQPTSSTSSSSSVQPKRMPRPPTTPPPLSIPASNASDISNASDQADPMPGTPPSGVKLEELELPVRRRMNTEAHRPGPYVRVIPRGSVAAASSSARGSADAAPPSAPGVYADEPDSEDEEARAMHWQLLDDIIEEQRIASLRVG